MKAIVVEGTKGEPELVWREVADVAYGPDEVLVAVRATAVNRADLSQARGNYPPPPGASEILGLEMAGVVTAVGPNVRGWQPGDRVCALLLGGGYAEQAAVPAGMLMRLPDEWTFVMGTAVPEVWFTAFINLFWEGGLQEGEAVLIHAGASGVGTAAIQLARAAGARVLVTASAEKLASCRALGAEVAIDYKAEDFVTAVSTATHGEGVDVILDPVGGSYLERNVRSLRRFGRLVNIGTLGGVQGEMNTGLLLGKRLKIVGSTLRTRPLAEKIAITQQFTERFWPGLRAGALRPIIDRTFAIAQAQQAHEYVAQNKNVGKVVLVVGE
ncbi:MAG: NAD(P)H-quinone oxidoreductase [Ardenticatenaceae bacterium]|nr:NAD(P)H-quinone oxidoreductase [Ardenticatenaceae bacterium]MCB8986252.1 NAD(P)H-quinone oxidoreductase [Ardenticatenaceae bacterium]